VLDLFALNLGSADELYVSLGKPYHQLADGFQRFRLMRFKDDAYPLD
jgi:hypothetical protein